MSDGDAYVQVSDALAPFHDPSDADRLVEFDPGRSQLDHAALWLELQELLERKVDVVSDRGIKPPIRDRVLREAAPQRGSRRSA